MYCMYVYTQRESETERVRGRTSKKERWYSGGANATVVQQWCVLVAMENDKKGGRVGL